MFWLKSFKNISPRYIDTINRMVYMGDDLPLLAVDVGAAGACYRRAIRRCCRR